MRLLAGKGSPRFDTVASVLHEDVLDGPPLSCSAGPRSSAGLSKTTVERLMRICGAVGIHYMRRGGCTRGGDREASSDMVNRCFDPTQRDSTGCGAT